MHRRVWIAAAATALLLTPFALSARAERPRPVPSPAAKPNGPPVSCIPLAQVNETRVRDDWTIDFISHGKRGWRNNLRDRCPGLRAANAITYATSLSQLCTTDVVYTLEQTPGPRRGIACNLGQFVPVELER